MTTLQPVNLNYLNAKVILYAFFVLSPVDLFFKCNIFEQKMQPE